MERNEIEQQYKWRTTDIFPTDEAWERAFAALEKKLDFKAYKGSLTTAEGVLAYFRAEEEFERELLRLYVYAHLRHDEDLRVSRYDGYLSRTLSLFSRLGAETAFVTPELSALSDETLSGFAEDARLKDYDYTFRRLVAEKKHVLSEGEERILALAGEPLCAAEDAFTMLNNAELNLPEIEWEGKRQPLSHGLYSVILSGRDRAKRAEAFGLHYSAYRKIVNTLATVYYANVKKDVFYKTARGYSSCLSMALFQEDVAESVYENLVRTVGENVSLLHRYVADRKRALGYEELHMYDLHVPIVENAELRLSYEDAFELVLKGLAPLGEEYLGLLKKGRDEGWIDVCETEGKRSGAYSVGAYGIHPFVLLNYQETTQDVFTIAHELGHALHTYFSARTQPQAKADYKIFVAEVASTVNEMLLLRYLLKTTEDRALRKYLLSYLLDTIRATLFRQTQFAEFEQEAHAMAERGEPLNQENLSELYLGLNRKYYGEPVVQDEEIAIEWARIPHFYTSFYVYKYATGITAAITIADRILAEGEPAVRDYLRFLSSGGMTDPVSLLQIAGADLSTDAPFEAAMKAFGDALEEFETLI